MGGHALIVLDTHVLIWLDSGDNRLGRLALTTLDEAYENREVAVAANELDGLPGDPADRFIVATAIAHDATLLTAG